MYLNLKNFENKYIKYKKKYKNLKNKFNTLIGGECVLLPNPEEYDINSGENLLDLCADERITIQNKCYDVNSLYRWIIIEKRDKIPGLETKITVQDRQRLIQAYEKLPRKLEENILTRDKLIKIYSGLETETQINLSNKKYTNIALGTFDNLPRLKILNLSNNYIQVLQTGTFNNLPELNKLYLNDNKIQEIYSGAFNNLPSLINLYLYNNQIRELYSGTFNNLLNLYCLNLSNNQIRELQSNFFYNLPKLNKKFLGIPNFVDDSVSLYN
jgi:Leucine-rich repeat (LRR) protein